MALQPDWQIDTPRRRDGFANKVSAVRLGRVLALKALEKRKSDGMGSLRPSFAHF